MLKFGCPSAKAIFDCGHVHFDWLKTRFGRNDLGESMWEKTGARSRLDKTHLTASSVCFPLKANLASVCIGCIWLHAKSLNHSANCGFLKSLSSDSWDEVASSTLVCVSRKCKESVMSLLKHCSVIMFWRFQLYIYIKFWKSVLLEEAF
jgi:hypothetical protein